MRFIGFYDYTVILTYMSLVSAVITFVFKLLNQFLICTHSLYFHCCTEQLKLFL